MKTVNPCRPNRPEPGRRRRQCDATAHAPQDHTIIPPTTLGRRHLGDGQSRWAEKREKAPRGVTMKSVSTRVFLYGPGDHAVYRTCRRFCSDADAHSYR